MEQNGQRLYSLHWISCENSEGVCLEGIPSDLAVGMGVEEEVEEEEEEVEEEEKEEEVEEEEEEEEIEEETIP